MIGTSILYAASLLFNFAQVGLPAALPAGLRPPANQVFLFQLHGKGVQIYTCQDAWTLKGPAAQLIGNDGAAAGHHSAGPTWQAPDGSRVIGKAIATSPSPNPSAVPWLLVSAIKHEGDGTMNRVLTIQRLNTAGGIAPADGCDTAHSGVESRVPYEADYYFYGLEK